MSTLKLALALSFIWAGAAIAAPQGSRFMMNRNL